MSSYQAVLPKCPVPGEGPWCVLIFSKSMSSLRVLTSSVPPHFILAHKILRIYLLNQMNYWTIGLILIPCARSPEPEEEAL